jgi:predicted porin
VQYFLPAGLGGFYGSVAYALHEQTDMSPNLGVADSRAGRHVGGRLGYASGPLDLAIAFGRSDTVYSNLNGKIKTVSFGGTYDFGPVKLFGEYSQSQDSRDAPNVFATTNDVDLKGYLVGVTVPVGPGVIRASYAQVKYDYNSPLNIAGDPKANKFAVGYVHHLSKRTAVYGTLARVSNKNGAGLTVGAGPSFVTSFGNVALAPKTSTGCEFGIRHSF